MRDTERRWVTQKSIEIRRDTQRDIERHRNMCTEKHRKTYIERPFGPVVE